MDQLSFQLLVVVCILTHVVRSVYEVMKHKKMVEPTRLTFVIMFSNMGILWMSWVLVCSHDISRISFPAVIHYFGALLAIIGIILFFVALFTIKSLESYDGDLITKGIYSKLRHPMYTAFILWLIGFPLFYGAIYSFFLTLLFGANILFWRYLEEKELVKRFPSYRDYQKTTLF